MPWNGNVTGSSVASIPQAHGPKEMDRVNRYFNDVDLEALAGDGSIATIRTKTRFRNNKFQFISDDGHIINFIIPTITNNKDITLPNDSGTLALGGGGTPISTITNLGVGGVGVFKNAAAGVANFYSLASISSAIDLALDAANNLIEIDLDETVINLSNLAGTLPISKGGTGQTTKTNAYDALSPTTTAGDIVYRNASGDNVRLAIGPNGYVLGVVSGIPAWIPAPAGGGGGGGGGTDVTLFRNTTVVDVVSTAAETNLFSFTVPANTIGVTGLVRILVTGSYINNSGSDDKYALRLKLGGTTIWSDESGTQSTSANRRPVFIQLFIKNNNSASSQKVGGTFINGNDVLGDVGISDISSDEIRGQSPIVASASINTAADQVLALTVDHDDSSSNISFQADIISVELIGGTGAGGTGDITGATNQGTGNGIFKDETSGLLNFKSLIAGTNITITPGTNDITIAATGGATPAGASGDVQYNSGSSTLAAEAAFNYDATNNELTVPGLTVNEDFRLNGEITPAQITANQNDYNPTNLATAARLRLSTDASRNITGLQGGADGRIVIITNVGSFDIVLTNEDALSTAANRFTIGASLTLTANKVAIFIYDSINSRWRLVSTSVDQTGGGGSTPGGATGDIQYNSGSSTFAAEAALTYDSGNNQLTIPGATIVEDLGLTGVISPAQITANQNDYNPTNLATSTTLRLNTDASRNITGLAGGATGRVILIVNVGSFDIVLKNEDAGSTAGNRFTIGADLTLTANKIAAFIYDNTTQRWRLVATSVDQLGSGATPGGATGDLQYNSGSSTFAAEAALTYDSANNKLTIPGLKIDNELRLNGEISPAQITANQNDYNPTNLATSIRVRLSTDASRNITGLVPIATSPDGEYKIITNVGSNNIVLTNEDAASTAANRFSFGSNLTLAAGNTAIIMYDANVSRWILLATTASSGGGAPTTAQYLTLAADAGLSAERVLTAGDGISLVDGGAGNAATIALDFIDLARKMIGYIEDFFNVTDKPNYTVAVSGTGAAFANVDTVDTGVFGVAQFTTGTTATGRACLYGSGATTTHQVIRLGQGITTIEGKIRLPALSTAAQEYRFIFGFGDLPTNPSQTEGCWIEYERANSVNWRYSTGDDNTKTENSSTTAVVANTWIRLKIVINAAASSVEFFVNGTSIGTTTTNIPSAAGDELFPICGIFKSAGTTASLADIDYYAWQIDLTTAR